MATPKKPEAISGEAQSKPPRKDSSKKKPKNFGNFRPLVAAIKGKEALKELGVGMRVKTQLEDTRAEGGVSEERGVVKYIGKLDSDIKGKTWVGIKFDNAVGDCTGKGARRQYFRCKPKFGKFLPPHYISLLSPNDMKDELAAMGGAKLWRQMDSNGNGLLSCAEFDKFIAEQLPQLHFAPAILQAFKRTGGDSVDNLLTAKHAEALVANTCYYVDLWVAFATGLSGDEGGLADRRLDEAASLGPALQCLGLDEDEDLAEVFSAMDADGGGVVRFQEFAAWVETRKPPPVTPVLPTPATGTMLPLCLFKIIDHFKAM